jgi:pimeloyl-ACP methyl ester carboxylesterase
MYAFINGSRLYFDVDGAQLRVEDIALPRVPTIVALLGGPGFDQGRSDDVPPETCTLERMADDTGALCELLGVERPPLLGHSAGGFVVLHAVLRLPESVAALILCNTAACQVKAGSGFSVPGRTCWSQGCRGGRPCVLRRRFTRGRLGVRADLWCPTTPPRT